MSEVVIKVENLSKLYRLGELHKQADSFREKVTHSVSRLVKSTKGRIGNAKRHLSNPGGVSQNPTPYALRPTPSSREESIWALKDVSFEVKRGEIVGIIGRNGAGKSTLLKILSRITKPTEGRAWINGRVGSLLEVGTGFHAELTGRENIYLNGAILGMTKAEIKRKFDEIVHFAEIEKFIDTPVKRYSSGMYVRLAFAVAAHLEPEILLVDEVLAVGDYKFQEKCIGKMKDISNVGRTVLFVSHQMPAVRKFCKRCFLIQGGKLLLDHETDVVLHRYLENNNRQVWLPKGGVKSGQVTLTGFWLVNSQGEKTDTILFGEPFQMHFTLAAEGVTGRAAVLILIFNDKRARVSSIATEAVGAEYIRYKNRLHLVIQILSNALMPGVFYPHLEIGPSYQENRDLKIDNLPSFTVVPRTLEGSSVPYIEAHGMTYLKSRIVVFDG